MRSKILEEEHLMFKESVEQFLIKEAVPNLEKWEDEGVVDRSIWTKAGEMGILCMDMPEQYGGMGIKDFRYNAIVTEAMTKLGVTGPGFVLQNDVMAPYFDKYFSESQKERWLSDIISGKCITAIAMTEPNTGSDLAGIGATAVRDGDDYILNGAKTYITNGILSDLVIVVAKTDSSAGHKGISLLLVERGMDGFERGKNLKKIGLKAQDTSELFLEMFEYPKRIFWEKRGEGFTT